MKPAALAGIVLIILGIVALAYGGFTYTTRDKVVDIGPLEVHADRKHTMPLSPILGVVALAGGLALFLSSSRKS